MSSYFADITLADLLTDTQFWQKPFPFGNSFGHLVLHLTGNLNYYIGAQIAKTGYVRDRPREFADPNPPSKHAALKRFGDAVAMVVETIRVQSPEDWSREYSGAGATAQTVSTWSCSVPATCSTTSAR